MMNGLSSTRSPRRKSIRKTRRTKRRKNTKKRRRARRAVAGRGDTRLLIPLDPMLKKPRYCRKFLPSRSSTSCNISCPASFFHFTINWSVISRVSKIIFYGNSVNILFNQDNLKKLCEIQRLLAVHFIYFY